MKSSLIHSFGMSAVRARRGFALVIALALMAFIFLLLISLGALSRTSLEKTNQEALQQMARQDAIVGLRVALGELQRFAGPDQRATATADIQTASNSKNGSHYWTGVWGNKNAAGDDERDPVLLNWLVSGNEAQTYSATDGKINSAGTPSVAPGAISAVNSGDDALKDYTIGSHSARMLVGPATAGDSHPDSFVIAPLVKVNDGTNTGGLVNRYAFWVGDEGVKARINMINPWPQSSSGSNVTKERIYGFGTAQRVAGEQVYGLDGLPSGGDPSLPDINIDKITESSHLGYFQGIDRDSVKARFHEVTPYSNSVLADARNGGLKRDLTQILRSSGVGSAAEADNKPIFPEKGSGISDFYAAPATWGMLRDFASFQNHSLNSTISPQTPRADRQGISPVLVYGGMFYTWWVDGRTKPGTGGATGIPAVEELWLRVYASPRFFLWNPYNRPLAAGRYEVGFVGPRRSDDRGIVTFKFIEKDTAGLPVGSPVDVYFSTGKGEFIANKNDMDRRMLRFTIEMNRSWNPGEVVAFSLPDNAPNVPDYSAGEVLLPVPPKQRLNYSNAARVLMAEENLSVKLAPSNPLYIDSVEMPMRRTGEVSMYLAVEGAGSAFADTNPDSFMAAAINPGSNNSAGFYQWIGRVEGSHTGAMSDPLLLPLSVSEANKVYDFTGPLPMLETSITSRYNADGLDLVGAPLSLIGYEVYHKQSATGDYHPSLPVRWIASANSRAYMQNRTSMESGNPGSKLVINPLYAGFTVNLTARNASMPYPYLDNNGEVTFGKDFNNSTYSNAKVRPLLFDLPSEDTPILSVGDLRHAAVSGHATGPTYAIGNSLADFRVGRDRIYRDVSSETGAPAQTLYDHSFLLNDALWDKYYFSTLPASGNLPDTLPNSRHVVISKSGFTPTTVNELTKSTSGAADPALAASHLLLKGGFNVNSTSVEAWRAVLAGLNGLRYDPTNPSSLPTQTLKNPFSRFRTTLAKSNRLNANNNADDYWKGYRELTEAELTTLAEAIVKQVKERGPFLSIADFVNRAPFSGEKSHQLKGALQAAIDSEDLAVASRINHIGTETSARDLSKYTTATSTNGYDDGWSNDYDVDAYMGFNTGTTNVSTARGKSERPFTRPESFAPGEVTQADVLAAIGATLTSRSDTFVVRSYGEVFNETGNSVVARAWCEAIVQRLPDYIDEGDLAQEAPSLDINKRFGRRFVVVGFRWLNADDI